MAERVLFLAAEFSPLAKVGGLADVAGDLPRALRALGLDVRLGMPLHTSIDRDQLNLERVAALEIPCRPEPQQAEVWSTEVHGVPLTLVDGAPVRQVQGVYAEPGRDAYKYTFACLAALGACEALNWRPDLIHANDWQMAAAILTLRTRRAADHFWKHTAGLFTIHNLPYMGAGGEEALESFGLGAEGDDRLPAWARRLPLPRALTGADWLSTVSPTYAEEIRTPEYGCGLEGILEARRERLTGILNGIDVDVWNPGTDAQLPARFSKDDLGLRRGNKSHLQALLGLREAGDVALLGMVTRMDHQKGVDLALDALETFSGEAPAWQLVLLGVGDPALEERARQFAAAHSGRAHYLPRFDPGMARLIYAASDLLLVPSRYEPSGLAQMLAMRYGSVPLVRSTGGLHDTVTEYAPGGRGTGFLFQRAEPDALADALRRAFTVHGDPRRWRPLQRRCMERDFSWGRSARAYRDLYRTARAGLGAS